jgi:hypothetical protein
MFAVRSILSVRQRATCWMVVATEPAGACVVERCPLT